jgi:PKD domain/Secretion system C-terminal sorting domain
MKLFSSIAILLLSFVMSSAQTTYVAPLHDANVLYINSYPYSLSGEYIGYCGKLLNMTTVPPTITNINDYILFDEDRPCFTFDSPRGATTSNNLGVYLGSSNMNAITNSNNAYLSYHKEDSMTALAYGSMSFLSCYSLLFNYELPSPNNPEQYYIFRTPISISLSGTLDEYFAYDFENSPEESGGAVSKNLYFDLIDFAANNGQGALIDTSYYILHDTMISEISLGTCRHANGRDWWLFAFEYDITPQKALCYHRFLVSPVGVEYKGEIRDTTQFLQRMSSFTKCTPDGKHLIVQHYQNCQLNIFEIDRCDGLLLNQRIVYDSCQFLGNSFAVSPNSRYIYTSDGWFGGTTNAGTGTIISGLPYGRLYQHDLEADDFAASRQILTGFDTISLTETMQLAPNGEIYFRGYLSEYIGSIHRPNFPGLQCMADPKAIEGCFTQTKAASYFPNEYRVGPVDGSSCDTLGIDNFPKAFFKWYTDSTSDLSIQFDNLSLYNPIDYFWDFGDGNTSTLEAPYYTYAVKGVYNVCLTASNEIGSDTYCELVYVDIPVGAEDILNDIAKMYPNPVDDFLFVELSKEAPSNGKYFITLYDVEGKMVLAEEIMSNLIHKISVSHLPAGLYSCQILHHDEVMMNQMIVKK